MWKKGNYNLGKFDRIIVEYYDNCKFKESISWIQDKKDGPHELFYDNGQLKALGYFNQGRKEGAFEHY